MEAHEVAAEIVLAQLQSNPEGLSHSDAELRLRTHGPNRLPESSGRSPIVRFLLHFHNVLIYVLLFAAAITASLGHWVDSFVIFAVVLLNAVVGFVQEGKAEEALSAIRNMLAPHASVLRKGQRLRIEGEKLVPGDIVILEPGDKVPADLRLLQTRGLFIQEAILTGESLPVEKGSMPVSSSAPLGDRTCVAYSGTLVASGQARGVVVHTGAATEVGRISGLLSEVKTLTTPLVLQMDAFSRWLAVLILLFAAALLLFGYFVQHYEFSEMFMAVVGLSVAAIPEGLPAVLTITLAIGVKSMARRNAIVRHLPAIETIGAVSVICSDKTGTLTRNEMMVASVMTHDAVISVEGLGYRPSGELKRDSQAVTTSDMEILRELGRAAALCNDAELHEQGDVWTVEGDPMEGALLSLAAKTGVDLRRDLCQWRRTDVIPFDSQHRFMATLQHDHEGHAFIFVKGAPERIVSMCSSQRVASSTLEPINKSYWQERVDTIAGKGERVLALALRPIEPNQTVLEFSDVDGTLTLIGMVGLIDPPRQEAIQAVAECQGAGIRVKMITGDHAGTAAAIGRTIGLQNPDSVLTGADIDALSDAALKAEVLETDIFARTSPEHKLRLVMALQSHGMTVAMTGDGVNDAPALKRADVGIAMGKKGSEAAKEAAEVVLADDNFASIAAAVREGRTVYDNIRKVISWTLPTNAGEAATIVVALLFGMALPITPIQILWVNLITAVTLGLALAFEPTEARTMLRHPRRRSEPLLSGTLLWHICLVSLLFLGGVFGLYFYAIDRGYSEGLARTIALNTLVVMEIFHLFFIRRIYGTSLTWETARGTRVVWMAVIAVTVAQFAVTYWPPLQRVFVTEAVPFVDGLLIIGVGVMLFAIIEVEKQLRLLFGARHP